MKTIEANANFKYPGKSKQPFEELLNEILAYLSSYPYEVDKLVFLVDSGNHNVSVFPGSPEENVQIQTDTILTAELSGYEDAFELDDLEMLRVTEAVEQWFIEKLQRAWKSFKSKERFANEFVNREYGVYLDLGGDFDTFDLRTCDFLWGADKRKQPNNKEEFVYSFCAKYDAEPTFLLGHDRPVSKVVVIDGSISKNFTPDLLSLADQLSLKGIPLWISEQYIEDFSSADLSYLKRHFELSFLSEEAADEYLRKICHENRERGKTGEERFVL